MQELDNYRLVRIQVECSRAEHPLDWTQHTTRTAERMVSYGRTVANTVCDDKSIGHQSTHAVTVSEPETERQAAARA